eukprot:943107-Rhodomonas_salina.1
MLRACYGMSRTQCYAACPVHLYCRSEYVVTCSLRHVRDWHTAAKVAKGAYAWTEAGRSVPETLDPRL